MIILGITKKEKEAYKKFAKKNFPKLKSTKQVPTRLFKPGNSLAVPKMEVI